MAVLNKYLQIDISPLVWKVFRRHLIVFSRNWKVNISFNFFEPLLYLAALGIGLGAYVQPIEGVPYLNYLAPGLVASSAVFATAYECTYGTFIRMEFQKTFHAMVATPVSMDDVIAGEILYGVFKSILYSLVILVVIFALGLVKSPLTLFIPCVMFVGGMLFAILSIIWTGLVPNIESFNYYFSLVMTPLFLFSGVFFPLTGMSVIIQKIIWISPLYHLVNITRGLILGRVGINLVWDLIWIVAAVLILLPVPFYLMRKLMIR